LVFRMLNLVREAKTRVVDSVTSRHQGHRAPIRNMAS